MQEEVTRKRYRHVLHSDYQSNSRPVEKGSAAYLRHQKQKSVEKKAKKNQPKQGKVTGKRAGKTECRDGQYRDHE